tara:strand:+ start:1337 stop:2164 length:828 start_codon:yes stop_codon:yes gene_type:complete
MAIGQSNMFSAPGDTQLGGNQQLSGVSQPTAPSMGMLDTTAPVGQTMNQMQQAQVQPQAQAYSSGQGLGGFNQFPPPFGGFQPPIQQPIQRPIGNFPPPFGGFRPPSIGFPPGGIGGFPPSFRPPGMPPGMGRPPIMPPGGGFEIPDFVIGPDADRLPPGFRPPISGLPALPPNFRPPGFRPPMPPNFRPPGFRPPMPPNFRPPVGGFFPPSIGFPGIGRPPQGGPQPPNLGGLKGLLGLGPSFIRYGGSNLFDQQSATPMSGGTPMPSLTDEVG